MLCYVMLCYVMLCYVMLCNVMSCGAERKFVKKITEANFSNLVSYLLYAY